MLIKQLLDQTHTQTAFHLLTFQSWFQPQHQLNLWPVFVDYIPTKPLMKSFPQLAPLYSVWFIRPYWQSIWANYIEQRKLSLFLQSLLLIQAPWVTTFLYLRNFSQGLEPTIALRLKSLMICRWPQAVVSSLLCLCCQILVLLLILLITTSFNWDERNVSAQ